jgi:hypothetical protein
VEVVESLLDLLSTLWGRGITVEDDEIEVEVELEVEEEEEDDDNDEVVDEVEVEVELEVELVFSIITEFWNKKVRVDKDNLTKIAVKKKGEY